LNIFELLIIQPIFNLLTTIYAVLPGGDFGVAIIVFTIIVRMLMYPLVRRQLHQTRMMRKLQPELKKIKKAANGNRQVEAMQMMELYKRHGVSPFRSIGILLLQLPIFIGLYYAITIYTNERDRIAEYTYDFLEVLPPVKELVENPETFDEMLFGIVDLTQPAIGPNGINFAILLLVLLASVTQYFMSKQTLPHDPNDQPKKFRDIMKEASEGKQTDNSELNALVMTNMVKIMPVLLFFIMINFPGALSLYYFVSNLVAIGQQSYLLKQDIGELEGIAEEPEVTKPTTQSKKQSSSANKKREKAAQKGNITRIVASDNKQRRK
jgi:YidC/Oxa1 family membrane protein insertase